MSFLAFERQEKNYCPVSEEAVSGFRSSKNPQAEFCRHISLICPSLTF